jgi:hypothetical protein
VAGHPPASRTAGGRVCDQTEHQLCPSYALSNAPADAPLARLAELKWLRFGIACANREAKSDLGWDDFRAQKYRAWEHHLALTILAAWFVAQTKLEWAQQTPPDPALAADLGVVRVPALSVANVRELLKASLPLPQLSPEQAQRLVVKHLVGRRAPPPAGESSGTPPRIRRDTASRHIVVV